MAAITSPIWAGALKQTLVCYGIWPSLSMLRSETKALVPSSLGGCNLSDGSFFSSIRKHQTARTFRTISIKVQSCALRNFAWIRNVALGNWRIQSLIMIKACWLCYYVCLCLWFIWRDQILASAICGIQGLILNSRLRVQSLLIHFDMSENWHNM